MLTPKLVTSFYYISFCCCYLLGWLLLQMLIYIMAFVWSWWSFFCPFLSVLHERTKISQYWNLLWIVISWKRSFLWNVAFSAKENFVKKVLEYDIHMLLLSILSGKRKKMKNSTAHGFLFVFDPNVNYLT